MSVATMDATQTTKARSATLLTIVVKREALPKALFRPAGNPGGVVGDGEVRGRWRAGLTAELSAWRPKFPASAPSALRLSRLRGATGVEVAPPRR